MASSTSVITVKVRSENTANGSSGSASWVRNCRHRNSPSSTTPTAITSGIVMNPATVPQSYRSPSISPNTTPNKPGGQQPDPEEVEPMPNTGPHVRHEDERQRDGDDADRDVEEEDPPPADSW